MLEQKRQGTFLGNGNEISLITVSEKSDLAFS
jgi:hypothetical protein